MKKCRIAAIAMRHTSSISFAFLRRHYPDQVRGTGAALRPDLSRHAPAPLGIVEVIIAGAAGGVKGDIDENTDGGAAGNARALAIGAAARYNGGAARGAPRYLLQ